jgi:peptidoglycan/xylan/chitin deacetylase (PgdA/CDA1 family)
MSRPPRLPLWGRLVEDVRRGRVPGHHRLRQAGWLLRARTQALAKRAPQRSDREIHAFVIWSRALERYDDILRDIGEQFVIRDVFEVDWSEPDFSTNMTRFYGGLLPANAEKEKHCGTDPFRVVVVEDRNPQYAPRPSPRGIVNTRIFDAKQRYREWTGGGHRIHASVDTAEAEHDLFLVVSRRPGDYLASGVAWDGAVENVGALRGAAGWSDIGELLAAVSVATTCERVGAADLVLRVGNRPRAALTAGARSLTGQLDSGLHEVKVAGASVPLRLLPARQPFVARRRREVPRSAAKAGIILLYHRVAQPPADPFRTCVTAESFERQLQTLGRRFPFAGLDELVERLDARDGNGQPLVVLTFDDGYADNLYSAQPIAQAAGVPITVFIAGRPTREQRPFWWDELAALVYGGNGSRATDVTLVIEGHRRRLSLGSERRRSRACIELHRLLRPLDPDTRRAILDEIAAQTGARYQSSYGRPLTAEELKAFAADPATRIGAHTVNHVALSALSADDQLSELRESKQAVEEVVGRRVDYFSYPFGRAADLGAGIARPVRDAGYRAACTTIQAAVGRDDSRYLLPRLTVHEQDAESLVARVTKLLEA